MRPDRHPRRLSRAVLLALLLSPLTAQAALIAEYRMDEASWNGTPGEVLDSSGNGRNGVRVGGPQTIATGKLCRAGSIPNNTTPGAVDAINTGFDIDATVGDRGTIAFWYRSNVAWNTSGAFRTLFDAAGVNDKRLFFLMVNQAGQLHWVVTDDRQQNVASTSGAFGYTASEWVHVAVTWSFSGSSTTLQIYTNGTLRRTDTAASSGAIGKLGNFYIGDNGNGNVGGGATGGSANGAIDEFRIHDTVRTQAEIATDMNATRPCGGIDHFVITHDRYGIHCANETLSVSARDSANNPFTSYTGQVTLDTQTGRGTWSLVAGSGTFADATANDGLATYTWANGESSATFALAYPEGTPVFDIDVYQTSTTTIRDDDTEGSMTFSQSGFTVTSSALANPPPGSIPAFASPQTAGASFAIHITAFGTTPTDPQCGVIESYTGAKNLKFWSTYVNPGTGTRLATIGGTPIATSEAGAAALAVTFNAGQAVVTGKYKDAGALQLSMKDDTAAHPDLPTGTRGGTGTVIFKPATFVLANIRRTADGFANPGATSATGPVFIAAGRPFSATVTALDAEGGTTPNYGRETPAESARLDASIVLPAGGATPAVAGPTGFGAFAAGSASGTDFSWPEVGIVRLSASVRDGSYLGAGDVTGTLTAEVGRFIPNHFDVTANAPLFQTACAAGSFTYVGQPFGFAVAPVLTVTARAFGGAQTSNYTGAFWKMTNTSLGARTYAAGAVALDTSGLPNPSVDPAIAPGAGTGTLTYGAGSGLAVQRAGPLAPFSPQITLTQNVADTDGVTAGVNPVTVGSPGGIGFSAGSEQRYGRLAFRNGAAPELFALPLPLTAEHYAGDATGFVANLADQCTSGLTLALGAFGGNLSAGETCVVDTGAPGASGAGCAAPGSLAQRFRAPPSSGSFNLHLAPPGAGNDGVVTVTATSPAWLRFDWDASSPGLENPSGTARFGVYDGRDRLIHQREVY